MNGNGCCDKCGAAIVWTITEAGKRMPFDLIPQAWPAGRFVIEERGRELYSRAVKEQPADGNGYVPHFATCDARPKKKGKG